MCSAFTKDMYHNDVVADNYIRSWGVWWRLSCWILIEQGSGVMNRVYVLYCIGALAALVFYGGILFIVIHFVIKYW